MADNPAEPFFIRVGPDVPASPVVLSVPHAGRDYSPRLLRASRLPREKLEVLEDRLVDRLVWRAAASGCTTLVARRPRAEIDLNRDPREIEPHTVTPALSPRTILQSPRTRSGLGLVPSRISGAGSIWLHPMDQSELRRRIEEVHEPYHAAVAAALAAARDTFGVAVLLDCHSMPPRGSGEPPIVFGDRHGTSIAPHLRDAAVGAAEATGYAWSVNTPYAGGYVTARHGRPAANIHAIQLEIDRSAYLDPTLREPGPGFDAAAMLVAAIAEALAECALGQPQAIAAE